MSSKKNVMGRTREWGRVQKCQKKSFSSTLLAGMVWILPSEILTRWGRGGKQKTWSVKRNTPATKWWRGKKKLVGKDKYGSGKRSWLVKRNTGAGIKLPRVPSGDRGLLMSLLSVSTEHHSATLLQTCSTKYTLPFTNNNERLFWHSYLISFTFVHFLHKTYNLMLSYVRGVTGLLSNMMERKNRSFEAVQTERREENTRFQRYIR